MSFDKHDAKLLKACQAFHFKFEGAGVTASEQGDAVRSLMFQVHNLLKTDNSGRLTSHQNVLSYYTNLYSNIVDEQDETKGLNNYAEQSIALALAFRNDSKNWKSSLTFESLDDFNISKIEAKYYQNKKVVECWKPSNIQPVNEPNFGKPNSTQGLCVPHFKRQPDGSCRSLIKPLFSKANQEGDVVSSKINKTPSNTQQHFTNNFSNSFKVDKFKSNRSKLPVENQTVDENTEDNGNVEFVTARKQFIINERKRKGNNENSQSIGNYGDVKKSLGYRRGPSSRFIPPVRNDEDENNDSCHSKKEYHSEKSTSRNHSSPDSEEVTDERLKGIEPRMIELVNNEIMDHGPPVEWHDIAGLEFAKTVIKEIVVWPMLRPDIFKGLRGPPKGLLLFGPPGTGKTLIGKCIASQSKATFFSISASSLTSKWVGEGEKMVRALFAVARCHQPAVIFIDEIDSLLSQRSDGEHDSSRRIKTEFLIQLDGAATKSDDRLLVVGATNRPQEIDEAARRRLVKRLYIPLPEGDARCKIISNLLKEQRYLLSEDDFTKLVQRSEGYSGSDMSNLCREAALGPIRSISGSIQAITSDQVRPILFTDFDDAFKQVRASVSSHDLDLYVQWNNQFGSGH